MTGERSPGIGEGRPNELDSSSRFDGVGQLRDHLHGEANRQNDVDRLDLVGMGGNPAVTVR